MNSPRMDLAPRSAGAAPSGRGNRVAVDSGRAARTGEVLAPLQRALEPKAADVDAAQRRRVDAMADRRTDVDDEVLAALVWPLACNQAHAPRLGPPEFSNVSCCTTAAAEGVPGEAPSSCWVSTPLKLEKLSIDQLPCETSRSGRVVRKIAPGTPAGRSGGRSPGEAVSRVSLARDLARCGTRENHPAFGWFGGQRQVPFGNRSLSRICPVSSRRTGPGLACGSRARTRPAHLAARHREPAAARLGRCSARRAGPLPPHDPGLRRLHAAIRPRERLLEATGEISSGRAEPAHARTRPRSPKQRNEEPGLATPRGSERNDRSSDRSLRGSRRLNKRTRDALGHSRFFVD